MQGNQNLSDENNSIMKMIQMACRFVKSKVGKAIILMDAYFASGDAFNVVNRLNDESGSKDITIITRTKAYAVA